jgi:uncharacterized protein (UPF0332 family)
MVCRQTATTPAHPTPLLAKGLTFSKHAGVIAAFGQQCAKTGEVPAEFHRYLIEAMELRQVGDYGRSHDVSPEQGDTQLCRAAEFIRLAKERLAVEP